MSAYVRARRKMFRNLADHCHDNALEAVSPRIAAQWMELADACLWITDPDGDADVLGRLAKEFADTPTGGQHD